MGFKERKKRFLLFVKMLIQSDWLKKIKQKNPHKLKRNNKNCKNEKDFCKFFYFSFFLLYHVN